MRPDAEAGLGERTEMMSTWLMFQAAGLDQYSAIRLINYIRTQVPLFFSFFFFPPMPCMQGKVLIPFCFFFSSSRRAPTLSWGRARALPCLILRPMPTIRGFGPFFPTTPCSS